MEDVYWTYRTAVPKVRLEGGERLVFRCGGVERRHADHQHGECTAYTEFGMPGPAPVEVLKTFLGEDELFPPRPGTNWETHNAFNA
jgi:hypothetical protein